MNHLNKELETEVKQLIINAADLEQMTPDDIQNDITIFGEGLGLDSIDVLEVVVELEKQYGLKIRNNESGKLILKNINSICEAISEHHSKNKRD